jgi:hypothetical protein
MKLKIIKIFQEKNRITRFDGSFCIFNANTSFYKKTKEELVDTFGELEFYKALNNHHVNLLNNAKEKINNLLKEVYE